MDPIKKAFSKIKEDILSLRTEVLQLKSQINKIQTIPAHNPTKTYQQTDTQTHTQTIPTHNYNVEPPYTQNLHSSTGNDGVPTNKQTDEQTHQQTHRYRQNKSNLDFKQANNILESLDSIKKEIRLKFKRLTPQEMLIFNTLYILEEENNKEITYRTIALQTNLSESSIRDYINKLTKKGIPIDKIRQNNKIILLKISQDLKNIATLATIQNLREL